MKRGKAKVDTKKKGDSRLAVKRKGAEKVSKKPAKKAAKDPNMPRRPPSAFFVFMEDFRKQFKEKNPNNKSVANVGKAGGAKWKSMSDTEKAPFVNKANERKADFQKAMADYEKKDAGSNSAEDGNESDRSKTEVHYEDEDEDEEVGQDAGINIVGDGNGSDSSKSEVHDDDDEDKEESGEEV